MDVTTKFAAYLIALAATDVTADDLTTECSQAQGAVRAATNSPDDLNTAYLEYAGL